MLKCQLNFFIIWKRNIRWHWGKRRIKSKVRVINNIHLLVVELLLETLLKVAMKTSFFFFSKNLIKIGLILPQSYSLSQNKLHKICLYIIYLSLMYYEGSCKWFFEKCILWSCLAVCSEKAVLLPILTEGHPSAAKEQQQLLFSAGLWEERWKY